MSDAVTGSMLGLIPVAMAGGIALGFTQEAMKIPGRISSEREAPETPAQRRRRRKGEKKSMSSTLWGPPPPGLM